MGILGVLLDHGAEIIYSFVMVLNHLVRLCSFMHISNVVGNAINAPAKRPNGLLKLLGAAVC